MTIEKINSRDPNTNGPVLIEDEKIHYTQQRVLLQFNKPSEEGVGTLYVTTK